MSDSISVSVIIPLYNAVRHLPSLLDALQQQTVAHQLVLLDSESQDGTRELLNQRGIDFIKVFKADFNHGRTRNLAMQAIDTEWIIFMTQDAIPVSELTFENLLKMRNEREDIALIYGRQLAYPATGIFGQLARQFHYTDKSIIKDHSLINQLGIRTCSCSNSFAAYRLADLVGVEGFPTDTILGEDVTVAAKLILSGKSIAYCAEAMVYHSHDYTIREEFKRYFDIGVFHKQQEKVLAPFTRAEGEGLNYAVQESKQLIKQRQAWRIPEQIIRLIAKYAGYRLGKWHEILPASIKKPLSMHSDFWQSK